MSELIKNKAIRGVAWSAVEKFARQGLMALFTILIARQLSPSDYGLVAMLTILLAIAQIFVDSGFVEALIQNKIAQKLIFLLLSGLILELRWLFIVYCLSRLHWLLVFTRNHY